MSTLSAYCLVATAATMPATHQGREKTFPALLERALPAYMEMFSEYFYFRE